MFCKATTSKETINIRSKKENYCLFSITSDDLTTPCQILKFDDGNLSVRENKMWVPISIFEENNPQIPFFDFYTLADVLNLKNTITETLKWRNAW